MLTIAEYDGADFLTHSYNFKGEADTNWFEINPIPSLNTQVKLYNVLFRFTLSDYPYLEY